VRTAPLKGAVQTKTPPGTRVAFLFELTITIDAPSGKLLA
jgi:hypothetical protein